MWNINPNLSVGPIALGMTANQAISILGEDYDTFKRVPDAEDTIYAYDDTGTHLTCNASGLVIVVSVFRPQEVFYSGIQLVGRAIQEVVGELDANGIKAEKEDGGYWISQAGVLLVEVAGVVDGIELYPS